MSIDLHVHTRKSDGLPSPCEAIKVAEKKGLDGIAITDHDKAISEDELDNLKNCSSILVIPGVEVTAREGHIILLGVHEAPEKNSPIQDVIRFGRRKNAVIIVPHPFDIFRRGIGNKIREIDFDAVEVYNAGSILNYFNKKALQYALKHKKVPVAGSDAHLSSAIGLAYTVIRLDSRTINDVLENIRLGSVYPVTRSPSILKIISLKIKRKIMYSLTV